MSRFKSLRLFVSDVSMLGVGHGWLSWVGRRKKLREKLSTPATGGHDKESPIADWVRAVEMIAEMNKQAERESNRRRKQQATP